MLLSEEYLYSVTAGRPRDLNFEIIPAAAARFSSPIKAI